MATDIERQRSSNDTLGVEAPVQGEDAAGMTFGEYLKHLWEMRGLSKNSFAAKLNVPFSTVNGWELHGVSPGQSKLQQIVDALTLTPGEKKKLSDLWLALPPKSKRRPGTSKPSDPPAAPAPPEDTARKALDALLGRALASGKCSLAEALDVFHALADAAPLAAQLHAGEDAAAMWLDAAALVRANGARITGATLAVALGALTGVAVSQPRPRHPAPAQTSENVGSGGKK